LSGQGICFDYNLMDKKHPITKETLLSTVISKDGTTIAFDRLGKGAVVLLMDGAMVYRDFRGSRPLAAELSKNFTAITFDQVGGSGARSRRDPVTVWRVFHPAGDWPTRRAVSWNHNHRSGAALLVLSMVILVYGLITTR